MFYVGLDIHARKIVIGVLDDNGQIYQRRTVRQIDQMMHCLELLPRPFRACYEASTGYGTFFELLSEVADYVAVAHPGSLRLIFRSTRKNGRHDAEKLAKLLYLNEVPTVHVPSAKVRAWRELITFRCRLVEKRTRTKNGIRALLRSLRIQPPRKPDLWSKRGVAWLQQLLFDNPMHALKRDLLVEELLCLTDQLHRVEKQLQRFAAGNAAVHLLRSIPGVGQRTAEAVVAFLDDPQRFANSKRVGSYFGLVPRQDQSGSSNRLGHITRQGASTVRKLLTEAAWQAVHRSPTVRAYFQRVQRGQMQRRKIAVVATAYYLVRVMWSMLKHGTLWQESQAM